MSELSYVCPLCFKSFKEAALKEHYCLGSSTHSLPAELAATTIRKTQKEEASMDQPWGHDVEIDFSNGPTKRFSKQGSLATVNRWAILKSNHTAHRIVGTYTRRQWIAAHGDGRIKT